MFFLQGLRSLPFLPIGTTHEDMDQALQTLRTKRVSEPLAEGADERLHRSITRSTCLFSRNPLDFDAHLSTRLESSTVSGSRARAGTSRRPRRTWGPARRTQR